MVFLRPFARTKGGEPLQNVVASDDVHFEKYDTPSQKYNYGKGVSNALFHNDAGHVFLKTVIRLFDTYFQNGKWASSGPVVFTKALEELCGTNKNIKPLNPKDHSRSHCSGMAVLEPRLFYPVDWFNSGHLLNKKVDSYWDELFKKSYVVHFYGTSTKTSAKVLRPNNYGKAKPSLTYLGVQECPISFFSARPF